MTSPNDPAVLRADRDRFIAFAFANADLLLELGDDERIAFAWGAVRRLTGRSAEELVGLTVDDLVPPDERVFIHAALSRINPGHRLDRILVHLTRADGGTTVVHASGCRMPTAPRAIYLVMALASPAVVAELQSVPRDSSSGLLAGKAFEARAARQLEAAGDLGRDLQLTMLDLVGFREFAARMAPEVNERVQREIGAALRAGSLGGDSAGRLSDSRYGVLHDQTSSSQDLERAIHTAVESTAGPAAAAVAVASRSVDFAAGELRHGDLDNVVSYALRTFAEKGSSGLQVSVATDVLRALVVDTVERAVRFRSTVAGSSFQLVYQPIVDLRTRQLHHYEALVRFGDGKSPFETIQFAEGVQLIHELDLAVVQTAVEQLRERRRIGANDMIAVNLSGRSLLNTIFMAAFDHLMKRNADLKPHLILEVTESSRLEDLDAASKVVEALRAAGHQVCLDDFGAGASSFPYLQALTIDYVKIDGAYIRRLMEAPRDRAIVAGMISLCRELKVQTIAEMVETEDQANAVAALGIDLGQGWLFGKAVATLPQPRPARPAQPAPAAASVTPLNVRRRGAVEDWR